MKIFSCWSFLCVWVDFFVVFVSFFFSCSADRQADLRSNENVKRNERVRKKNTTKLAEYIDNSNNDNDRKQNNRKFTAAKERKKWAFCVCV